MADDFFGFDGLGFAVDGIFILLFWEGFLAGLLLRIDLIDLGLVEFSPVAHVDETILAGKIMHHVLLIPRLDMAINMEAFIMLCHARKQRRIKRKAMTLKLN